MRSLNRRLQFAGSSLISGLAAGALFAAQPPSQIVIPGRNLATESLTSTSDGSIFVGSATTGTVFRAAPGAATARAWIDPVKGGLHQVLGLLADERTKTLWVCSSIIDDKPAPPSSLHAFDISSGAVKGAYPLPTAGAACNDIAVGADGTVYATDMANMEVVRLPAKAKSLEVWTKPGDFGSKGKVLDGIAVLDGHVIVNVLEDNKLFSVPIGSKGEAGTVKEISLDRAVKNPDGQRSFGNRSLLVVENNSLTRIDLSGPGLTVGKVSTLKSGFPDDAAGVTVVGETAYVIQAQWESAKHAPKPFQAVAVHVGPPPS